MKSSVSVIYTYTRLIIRAVTKLGFQDNSIIKSHIHLQLFVFIVGMPPYQKCSSQYRYMKNHMILNNPLQYQTKINNQSVKSII